MKDEEGKCLSRTRTKKRRGEGLSQISLKKSTNGCQCESSFWLFKKATTNLHSIFSYFGRPAFKSKKKPRI